MKLLPCRQISKGRKFLFLKILFFSICLLGVVNFQFLKTSHFEHPSNLATSTEADTDCTCQSMFTIGGCNLDAITETLSFNRTWKNLFKKLQAARNGGTYSVTHALHELSRYMPSTYQVQITLDETGSLPKYEFSNTNPSRGEDMKSQYFSRMSSNLPYVPCKIHNYSDSDIKQCLVQRKKITGQPLRIAFVGDSQVRIMLEQLIERLQGPLGLKSKDLGGKNLTTNFIYKSFKEDFTIFGEDIEMKLHWSTFLGKPKDTFIPGRIYQGAKDTLEAWNVNGTTVSGDEIPDLIYFDTGMWAENLFYEVDNIDNVRSDFEKLMPTLSGLSKKTRLIFRTLTTYKPWLARSLLENKRLDMVNQLAWLGLVKTGTWIWDSMTPIYLKEIDECWNHWRTGYGRNLPSSWACDNFQHLSKISENIGSNMIWNYFCNDIKGLSVSYCCSN